MSIPELDALEAGTTIYLPAEWDVHTWQLAGRVPGRNFYTLLHPPDQDGVISDRRPYYIDGMQLMPATLDEQSAWLQVIQNLEERKLWIYQIKLTQDEKPRP